FRLSLNLDPRSFRLDFEITLVIYDADFTSALRGLQEDYLSDSSIIDLAACRSRSAIPVGSYDALDRVTQTADPLTHLPTAASHNAGNVQASVDPRGNRTTIAYDARNRATQTTDALGDLSTVVYDTAGNLQATVNPRGNRTTFVPFPEFPATL